MTSRHRKWIGKIPDYDFAERRITDTFIDGRTCYGSWAIMHPDTHAEAGCGLGVGRGQKYQWQGGGWYRVDEKEGA